MRFVEENRYREKRFLAFGKEKEMDTVIVLMPVFEIRVYGLHRLEA